MKWMGKLLRNKVNSVASQYKEEMVIGVEVKGQLRQMRKVIIIIDRSGM